MSSTHKKLTAAHLAIAKRPNSKAIPLKWYLKDHIGLLHNPATPALREEFALAQKAVKGRNAPAIVEICRGCVGDGADGNCREAIRNCEMTDCFLFAVRPYQLKSKVDPKNVTPDAFLSTNASEVIGRPSPSSHPSKKRPPQHTADCFSLEVV